MRRGLLDVRPLRDSPTFRTLWLGSTLAAFAGQLTVIAVLYQVWEQTRNPLMTGMVGLAAAFPRLAGSLLGGTLSDTRDRRLVLLWAACGQTSAVLGLALHSADLVTGLDGVGPVLALVGANSFTAGMGAAARRSMIARLVSRDLLPAAVALGMLTFHAAGLFGPALGGLLIGAWGLTVTYSVITGCAVVALLAVLLLPAVPPQAADAPRNPLAMTWEGLRYVTRPGAIRGAFGTDLFATLMAMPVALFPMINDERLGGDPETLGLMTSAMAVGGTITGVLSGHITRSQRLGLIQIAGASVWSAAMVGLAFGPGLIAVMTALAVAGAADTVSVIARGALVQLRIPDSRRGRVTAVDDAIAVAGPDLGNARAGAVAAVVGAPAALALGGTLSLLGIGWILWRNTALRTFRRSDAADDDGEGGSADGSGAQGS
ncbi:MAG: MFS transporter [Nesterenkonia sp.]|nr:MFS transporter [Nesterenkonia sp.]